MTTKSRCTYCSSINFGKGCRYGPHGVHFHPNDSTRCAYCNSPNYGKGCRVNPTSDLHVHGITFNTMFRETVQSFLDNKVLIKELKKDFTEFECFKCGIIDENGNKVNSPVTEEQKSSFSPMVKTLIKIKRHLGSKVELLQVHDLLENRVSFDKDLVQYEKILTYKDKIDDVINNLYQILDEAQRDGVSIENIKKLIQA